MLFSECHTHGVSFVVYIVFCELFAGGILVAYRFVYGVYIVFAVDRGFTVNWLSVARFNVI